MKALIYSMAVAVLACVAPIGFTPARATVTASNLQAEGLPSTAVHCRRVYHCDWDRRGNVKIRRCHVCP
jgi:hypothetical protein